MNRYLQVATAAEKLSLHLADLELVFTYSLLDYFIINIRAMLQFDKTTGRVGLPFNDIAKSNNIQNSLRIKSDLM